MIQDVTPILVVAVLLGVGLGGVPLLDPDEARFARTSVEMLRSGDPVVPTFGGEPRLVKPPLLHWIQSALFSVWGPKAWVARLPAVLATLGSLLLVGWIARLRLGEEGGPWAMAIFGTLPLVIAVGHLGTLDALLAVHVLAAVALDLAQERGATRYAPLALGALLGLAFLVKGPVGVVLPLVVILAGRTAAGMELLPRATTVLQVVAGWCFAVLPWGLAFLGRVGPATALGLLRTEAMERYFAGTDHVESPLFFLKVVAVGFLPWVAPLIVALVRVVGHWRDPASRTARYAAAGLVAGLIFFSLGQSKLATYVLPLAPLAALLVTCELARELETPDRRGWSSTLLTVTLALFAAALALLGAWRLEEAPRLVALIGAPIFAAGTVAAARGLARNRPRVVFGATAAAGAAFLFVAVLILLPYLAQRKTAAYLVDAVPALRSGRPVAVVDMQVPSLGFYLDRTVDEVPLAHLASRIRDAGDTLWVFDHRDLARASPEALAALREVGGQGKYLVFERVAP